MAGTRQFSVNLGLVNFRHSKMNVFTYLFVIYCSLSMVAAVYQVANQDDFDYQLKNAGEKLVVVNFFATWSGPSKMIAPRFEAMSKEYTDVVFLKVDVDESETIASSYNIEVLPTFVYLKNGVKVAQLSGANENQIRTLIERFK
ncbi:hypothetical protein GHT06_015103 [Daphnia sinensis]|uniref:Thioredoxin domain-containing protein n=1 Tax=Daphnia sinensis TaxID=1820382 RepID=A0AAD5LAH4_9CRUS|nr:hypothetical protein GHT06_015103 [Daphnia sinensis]